jgi:hypothetical protein
MIDDRLILKDMEEICHGIIWMPSLHLPKETEKIHKNSSQIDSVSVEK